MMATTRRLAIVAAALALVTGPLTIASPSMGDGSPSAAAATGPNIFVYNLDDLRDAFPGGIDPLQYMPKVRQWMSLGTRYTKSFVSDPSCCPSRSSLMTGRYPHNNGVLRQQDGALFDAPNSMACYLRNDGYSTYIAGKFLTTWPKAQVPPCFQHSSVIWGGYNNVAARVDGVPQTATGYSTTYLGNRGRQYITDALAIGAPFLLYETPQAPHWTDIPNPDGTTSKLAIPEAKYSATPVGTCSGVPETDRSDKPAYVRTMNHTTAQGQQMCASQMRAIMSADDQFGATMQLLSDRGVLANTLVIFTSDNGYMWGEHGRWEKFVPYEPSIRVPLSVRWPGHFAAGVNATRTVSTIDLLPTMLEAAAITPPAGGPPLDGESLLQASRRTTTYAEYYNDASNKNIPSWRMVRTANAKYVQTYSATGAVIAREYYNLTNDPAENTNLLGDGNAANDPPASTINNLTTRLNTFRTCAGAACVS